VAARILLATWGSHGDLYPYLGLAVRLQAMGASPVLATCPFHRPIVERAGVDFRPLRPDVDPAATEILKRVMDPSRGSEVIIREMIVPALRQQYDDLLAAAQDADVMVSHPVTFAVPIAADVLNRPWLSSVLAPLSFFSVFDFPALPPWPQAVAIHRVGGSWTGRALKRIARTMTREWTAPVRALRADAGLQPAGDPLYEGQFSPYGTLAMFSRVMGAPQPDWPPRTEVTGFVFYNGPSPSLPALLAAFLDAGDPPLVFTLGTSAVGAAGDFYRESVAAAKALGRRAVLLTGYPPENRPTDLPASVLTIDYAPHELLFPRGAAIVHHGGVGTTGQALRAGHPMLVVPFAHDQPDNAHRLRRLGVARVVYPRQYNASRVAREIAALLDTPSYAARAADAAATVRAEPGADRAAETIMRLCQGKDER